MAKQMMFKKVTARVTGGQTTDIVIDRNSDECPICHFGFSENSHWATLMTVPEEGYVGARLVYQCQREGCREVFIAQYEVTDLGSNHRPQIAFILERVVPAKQVPIEFSAKIERLSPKFVETFNQAHAAESEQLDELVGPGYRKALEFLIKDYAIKMDEENAENIRKKFLGRCIEDHIDDDRIKRCAKSAAWLGNDHTHYEQRWTGKDIKDLKTLVTLTKNWIENGLLTEELDLTRRTAGNDKP